LNRVETLVVEELISGVVARLLSEDWLVANARVIEHLPGRPPVYGFVGSLNVLI